MSAACFPPEALALGGAVQAGCLCLCWDFMPHMCSSCCICRAADTCLCRCGLLPGLDHLLTLVFSGHACMQMRTCGLNRLSAASPDGALHDEKAGHVFPFSRVGSPPPKCQRGLDNTLQMNEAVNFPLPEAKKRGRILPLPPSCSSCHGGSGNYI